MTKAVRAALAEWRKWRWRSERRAVRLDATEESKEDCEEEARWLVGFMCAEEDKRRGALAIVANHVPTATTTRLPERKILAPATTQGISGCFGCA